MNRRSLFLSALGASALGLLAAPLRAAEALPRKVYARAARGRRNIPSLELIEFYGGKGQPAAGHAISRLRVLGYDERRDIKAIRAPGSDRIERLEPVRGSERRSIRLGTTEADAVTLHLSESDFNALSDLLGRLAGDDERRHTL